MAWTSAKGTQIVGLDQVAPRDDRWQPTAYGMNAFSPSRRWLAIYRGYTRVLHVYALPEWENELKAEIDGWLHNQ